MEDIIALRATTDSGSATYFLTWGRIQDRLDPRPVEALLLRVSPGFKTAGPVVAVELCASLQEASDAPFFYEGLFSFARQGIPFGNDTYEPWRARIAERMESGKEIFNTGPFD